MTPAAGDPRTGVFLDTSALLAALDREAQRHAAVAEALTQLMRDRVPLVTTDAVIAELHGLTLGRLGPRIALDAVDRLLTSPRVRVVGPGPVLDAVEFLRGRPDRPLSLTDALSFATMRDLGLTAALALDADFYAEGFAILP